MLKMRMPLAAQIHTFGFGYNLYSGLLKAIAEIGGGNYAFIPDSSMLVRSISIVISPMPRCPNSVVDFLLNRVLSLFTQLQTSNPPTQVRQPSN